MSDKYSDDYSDDESHVSAIRIITSEKKRKSPRITSAFDKIPASKKPITKSSKSAMSTKHARSRSANTPIHGASRAGVTNWMKSIKRSGKGLSTESTSNDLSNLDASHSTNTAFRSTSDFLRQQQQQHQHHKPTTASSTSLAAKSGRARPHTAPTTPGAKTARIISQYKSQEEYYDELQLLKKNHTKCQLECSLLRSKLLRLEQTSDKASKEMQAMIDGKNLPTVHNPQQKILKLEQQLKEKSRDLSQLQASVKSTNISELKVECDVMFSEIQRLTRLLTSTSAVTSGVTSGGATFGNKTAATSKTAQRVDSAVAAISANKPSAKEFKDIIARFNEKIDALTSENNSLKTDLDKSLEKSRAGDKLDMAGKLKKMEEEAILLRADLEKTKQILRRTQDEREKLNSKLISEKKENSKLNKDINELEAEMDKMVVDKNSTKKRQSNVRADNEQKSDEGIAYVQAALRGHMTRSRFLDNKHDNKHSNKHSNDIGRKQSLSKGAYYQPRNGVNKDLARGEGRGGERGGGIRVEGGRRESRGGDARRGGERERVGGGGEGGRRESRGDIRGERVGGGGGGEGGRRESRGDLIGGGGRGGGNRSRVDMSRSNRNSLSRSPMKQEETESESEDDDSDFFVQGK